MSATQTGQNTSPLRLERRKPTEEQEQLILARWLDLYVGPCRWMHAANERKCSPAAGARLKRLGVKAGVPDVLIFVAPEDSGYVGAAIELKSTRRGAVATPEQVAWLASLESAGWAARVCRGAGEAISWLRSIGYGCPGSGRVR